MYWVSIDPGINCGIAFFKDKELISFSTIRGRGKDWKSKVESVANGLRVISFYFKPEKVFIEWPTFHFRGNIVSLLKLCFLIGKISECFLGEIILIPVIKWKGNLKKKITWKRAEKFFGVKNVNKDAGDALAIGKWVIENEI